MKTMKQYKLTVTFNDGVIVPVTGYASSIEIAMKHANEWAHSKRERPYSRVTDVRIED